MAVMLAKRQTKPPQALLCNMFHRTFSSWVCRSNCGWSL